MKLRAVLLSLSLLSSCPVYTAEQKDNTVQKCEDGERCRLALSMILAAIGGMAMAAFNCYYFGIGNLSKR